MPSAVLKTHCKYGHEWTPDNTYQNPKGYLTCRTCNREAGRKWVKENYQRLMANPEFVARKHEQSHLFRQRHPDKVKQWSRAKYWHLRHQVIVLYGGKCAFCGFADERALQLDHVNGGGARQKKDIGSIQTYKRAIAAPFTGEYQLLCANCNWIKAYEAYEKERNVILCESTNEYVS